ncbi:MAG: ribonuclease HII [Thaumarchaeota archaeon]|nr:MAG: ribonuclease HII [Candidatus Wolframiiraptor sp.]RLG08548.1 MAG: ribonuclease HII [Nitrososphaerota archaeon]
MKVCGIDEAGRGAVIGPMVVAGVLIEQSRTSDLIEIGVKDSKKLTPGTRAELSKLIRDIAEAVEIVVLDALTIDSSTRRKRAGGLNELEARIFAKIINRLKPDAAYIDLPSTKYSEFRALIEDRLTHKCSLILEHKADEKYPVVSAASIVAKNERDRLIEELKLKLGDFGSGYPSDSKTRRFLMELIRSREMDNPHIRSSWRTLAKIAQRKLDEFING